MAWQVQTPASLAVRFPPDIRPPIEDHWTSGAGLPSASHTSSAGYPLKTGTLDGSLVMLMIGSSGERRGKGKGKRKGKR